MTRIFRYRIGTVERTVQVDSNDSGFSVHVGSRVFAIAARPGAQGRLDLEIDGQQLRAYAVRQGERTYVALDGEVWTLETGNARQPRQSHTIEGSGKLEAAMPGRVLDVLVAEGDNVKRGDTLVLLEAMKMELRIQAPVDGEVRRVEVTSGQVVERGQLLVEVTASA